MKKSLPLILFFVLAVVQVSAHAYYPPAQKGNGLSLDVQGDGVKRLIVVSKLPVTVHAPGGAALYFWQVPENTKAVDQGETLLIREAPEGTLIVKVKAVFVDWDKKKFETKFGTMSLVIGDVAPGPDQPKPESGLERNLAAALKADMAAGKGTRSQARKFAAVFLGMADESNSQAYQTLSQITKALATELNRVTNADALPKVRAAIGAYLNDNVREPGDAILVPELRARLRVHYTKIGDALDNVAQ